MECKKVARLPIRSLSTKLTWTEKKVIQSFFNLEEEENDEVEEQAEEEEVQPNVFTTKFSSLFNLGPLNVLVNNEFWPTSSKHISKTRWFQYSVHLFLQLELGISAACKNWLNWPNNISTAAKTKSDWTKLGQHHAIMWG